jgi:hypothetical protein
MALSYTALQATALRLLTNAGADAVITSTARGTGTFKCVRVKDVKHVLGDTGSYGSAGVQLGDTEFLLQAAAEPVRGERMAFAGDSYLLVQCEPIAPAGVVVVWKVYGRPASA